MDKHFIKSVIKRPGALHRATNTPKGQKIPESKVRAAEHSSNPRVRREAEFDENVLEKVRPHGKKR